MPTPQWRTEPVVIQQLLDEPHRFQFFQAVRLLELWLCQNGVPHDRALTDYVRFQNSLSLSFPGSEIESLTPQPHVTVQTADELMAAVLNGQASGIAITPAFMGYLGIGGVLPNHYTEQIALFQYFNKDEGIRAFLDVYMTRALTLFYKASAKYRIEDLRDARGGEPLLVREARNRDEFAAHLKSYRRGPRTISGIPGGEIVDGVHEDNGTTGYSCEWESIPDQNDVFRPDLDLEFTSGHSTRPGGQPVESSLSAQAVLMLWDKISSSIRVRPTQAMHAPVTEAIPLSLGAVVHANEACPATGWWQCDVDYEHVEIESGARQYFRKGDKMPQAVMLSPPTLGQRFKRLQPRFQSEAPTRWKLVQLVG